MKYSAVNRWPRLGHIKIKFSLSFPPASEFPAASIFFFICLIPHDNKVYGFVSVVVINSKSKKHDFPGFLEKVVNICFC